ncbi:MAG: hydroxyethylthiazole kinase [Kiritimatiellae bacterium]|nr:hydroxyethylthiazole kinase [Kiritimatiellia bacterium]
MDLAKLKNSLRRSVEEAARRVRAETPLAPSITNTVTINFVANAQLAAGGSAAMVYMPDEGVAMARAGGALYINMGTIFPFYAETLPATARELHALRKNWVLDPVGIGMGEIRMSVLAGFKATPPPIVRCNASEIIALAALWGLDTGRTAASRVKGVDSHDSVEDALPAAVAVARHSGGAVAVSGAADLVTDGRVAVRCPGGSDRLGLVTGGGCSLGGVMAVYAAVADPLAAALAATCLYNLAAERAAAATSGPGAFQPRFLDELHQASPAGIAAMPMNPEGCP